MKIEFVSKKKQLFYFNNVRLRRQCAVYGLVLKIHTIFYSSVEMVLSNILPDHNDILVVYHLGISTVEFPNMVDWLFNRNFFSAFFQITSAIFFTWSSDILKAAPPLCVTVEGVWGGLTGKIYTALWLSSWRMRHQCFASDWGSKSTYGSHNGIRPIIGLIA